MSDRDAAGANGREIYTSNADGTDPLRLTTNAVEDTEPAYSPDGTRIAFTRSNDTWVMNANGSGQTVAITGPEGPDSEPAWSPDGTQIVYVSNQTVPGGGTTGPELFVKNADPSATARRLTDTPNNAASRAPAWSPDATRIAFERGTGTNVADPTKEIWTMRADGTDPVQLTSNSFYDVQPAGRPRT